MAKAIYRITLLNWSKHNAVHKRSFKKTLISNNFCSDSKIQVLSMNSRWLFLNLVLTCGDLNGDTVELSSSRLRTMLECNRNIDGVLDQLQSLQLLTYEKMALSEVKLSEVKRREEKRSAEPTLSVPATIKKIPELVLFKISSESEIHFPKDLLFSWSDTYPKEFIEEELKKARSWVLANPHKAPKSAWGRFLNQWLTRGWERYRTTLKSNPVKVTAEDLEAFMASAS